MSKDQVATGDVFSIRDKVVVITGGAGHIGRRCVRAFARGGSKIVICGRPVGDLPRALAEAQDVGADATTFAVDLTDAAQVEQMATDVSEHFGCVDTLVSVAGGSDARNQAVPQFSRGALLDLDPDDFLRSYLISTSTAYLAARSFVPDMISSGGGSIINMGSLAGFSAYRHSPALSAYAAAKAALHNRTASMAHQWAPTIRVNSIAPGTIDTPRPAHLAAAELGAADTRIDLGRAGRPDKIGHVAMFLASEASSFINGSPFQCMVASSEERP